MGERELIRQLLGELRPELKHQTEFIKKLRHFHDHRMNSVRRKGGFTPLDSISELITTLEHRYLELEKLISELEAKLRQ
jgi:hypothetical protein